MWSSRCCPLPFSSHVLVLFRRESLVCVSVCVWKMIHYQKWSSVSTAVTSTSAYTRYTRLKLGESALNAVLFECWKQTRFSHHPLCPPVMSQPDKNVNAVMGDWLLLMWCHHWSACDVITTEITIPWLYGLHLELRNTNCEIKIQHLNIFVFKNIGSWHKYYLCSACRGLFVPPLSTTQLKISCCVLSGPLEAERDCRPGSGCSATGRGSSVMTPSWTIWLGKSEVVFLSSSCQRDRQQCVMRLSS